MSAASTIPQFNSSIDKLHNNQASDTSAKCRECEPPDSAAGGPPQRAVPPDRDAPSKMSAANDLPQPPGHKRSKTRDTSAPVPSLCSKPLASVANDPPRPPEHKRSQTCDTSALDTGLPPRPLAAKDLCLQIRPWGIPLFGGATDTKAKPPDDPFGHTWIDMGISV